MALDLSAVSTFSKIFVANYDSHGNEPKQTVLANGNFPNCIAEFQATDGGWLPPRLTTAQRTALAHPAAGMTVYDTTLNQFMVYTSALVWSVIAGVTGATYMQKTTLTPAQLTVNSGLTTYELVPAPPASMTIYVQRIYMYCHAGTPYAVNAGDLVDFNLNGGDALGSFELADPDVAGLFSGANGRFLTLRHNGERWDQSTSVGKSYVMTIERAAPPWTGGAGENLDIYVFYSLIPQS